MVALKNFITSTLAAMAVVATLVGGGLALAAVTPTPPAGVSIQADGLSPECALGMCDPLGGMCSWGLDGGCYCDCHDLESDMELWSLQ